MTRSWLSHFSSKENLRKLVQESLGCKCPLEVFDRYTAEWISSAGWRYARVVVGDRLLMYMVPCNKNVSKPNEILELTKKGIRERDGKGLNRFRLVFVEPPQGLRKNLEQVEAAISDPKVHFHILNSIFENLQ